MTPKLSLSLRIYYECERQLCQLGDAQADSRLSFSLTGVRTCWHQRTFCWKLDWQVHNCNQGPQKKNLYFFKNSHCYKQCPAAKTHIQLSWCIFRFSILFLMWRRWHLCSHLRSVLLVDTFESLKGETSSHAVIPADTGAQGISRIPFNDKLRFKKGNGDQFNSLTEHWCINRSCNTFFFSNSMQNDCCFQSIDGFFVTQRPTCLTQRQAHAALLHSVISLLSELLH